MMWKHFPHYWPFVRGIHQSLVNSLTKVTNAELGCCLCCCWTRCCLNSRVISDLKPSYNVMSWSETLGSMVNSSRHPIIFSINVTHLNIRYLMIPCHCTHSSNWLCWLEKTQLGTTYLKLGLQQFCVCVLHIYYIYINIYVCIYFVSEVAKFDIHEHSGSPSIARIFRLRRVSDLFCDC